MSNIIEYIDYFNVSFPRVTHYLRTFVLGIALSGAEFRNFLKTHYFNLVLMFIGFLSVFLMHKSTADQSINQSVKAFIYTTISLRRMRSDTNVV